MVIWSLTYTHQVDGEWQWSGDYAPRDAWCHVIRTSAPFVQWRGIKLPETSALSPMETSHHHSSLCSQQFFVFRHAQEEHRHLEKILYVIYDLWVYLQDDQQSFRHKSFRVGALEIILSLPVFLICVFARINSHQALKLSDLLPYRNIFLEKHWKSVISRSICDHFFDAQSKVSILNCI